jgi:hypothetical protein
MKTADSDLRPEQAHSDQQNQKKLRSKIGRQGVGTVGQNWAESPEVAQKGRYAEGNKIQGDDPDFLIDTDDSEAV